MDPRLKAEDDDAVEESTSCKRGHLVEAPPHPLSRTIHQLPVFAIEAQGSAFGFASPFCSSSIEMPSGLFTKAM